MMRFLQGPVVMILAVVTTCYGDTDDFDERVRVTQANAARYDVRVEFHTGAQLLTVKMPYAPAGTLFDNAILWYSSGEHDLKIPVGVKKNDEKLFIAFWATRTVLNASTLSIRFHRENEVEGLVYVLAMKDFLP